MVFREPKSANTAKFCVFNRLPIQNNLTTLMNSDNTGDENQSNVDAGFEQRVSATGSGSKHKSQYIIHSEVI